MKSQVWSIVTLRVVVGWYMLGDGLVAVFNPNWSAAGFLAHAKTFPDFYAWFATPANLVWVNPLNEWGIVLIGVALLLGVAVRPASWAGAILMILYYFPHYSYPYMMQYGWIVEEHIVLAAAFYVLAVSPLVEQYGLGAWVRRSSFGRIPLMRKFI